MKKKPGLRFYEPEKKVNPSIFTEIFTLLLLMMIAAFIAVVCVYFFGMTSNMVGASMEPTLYNGQEILVNRFAYTLFVPQKGDVVVFLPHGNEKSHYYVKRIVAGPGDKVQIVNGTLMVNDEASRYCTQYISFAGIAENQLTLKNGEYFCMGDNPLDGEDSRQADLGPVGKDDIIGIAWFRMKYGDAKMGFIR